MIPEVIGRLIESGAGSVCTWTNTGPAMIINIPIDTAFIITQMRVKAFADLPAGQTFTSLTSVMQRVWHQITIRGMKGQNTFHARHEVRSFVDAGNTYYLPQGETVWDLWLNHERDVIIEIVSPSAFLAAGIVVGGPVPAELKPFANPVPPGGYGRGTLAGSLTAIESITVGGAWQVRPFGKLSRVNPPNIDSRGQLQVPTNAATRLNNPQPAIAFGQLTFPVIEITGVLFNKKANETFTAPLSL